MTCTPTSAQQNKEHHGNFETSKSWAHSLSLADLNLKQRQLTKEHYTLVPKFSYVLFHLMMTEERNKIPDIIYPLRSLGRDMPNRTITGANTRVTIASQILGRTRIEET